MSFLRTVFGLFLVFGLAAAPLSARTVPSLAECAPELVKLATQGPEYWVGVRKQLEAKLRAGEPALAPLQIEASQITSVNDKLGQGYSGAVFSVTTARGKFALKGHFLPNAEENHVPGILIQQTLGDLGISPKVVAVLDAVQMAELGLRFPRLGMMNLKYGLLMEQVGEGASIKERQAPIVQVDWARQQRRLEFFGEVMGYLRICPNDVDMMFTPEGDLTLHDIDFYTWVSETGEVFSYDRMETVNSWGVSNGDPHGFRPKHDFSYDLARAKSVMKQKEEERREDRERSNAAGK